MNLWANNFNIHSHIVYLFPLFCFVFTTCLLFNLQFSSIFYCFNAVNIPPREYQLAITKTSLFCNTLVALPTGLGKTLIAAVVMYNYFRWFPDGNTIAIILLNQLHFCLWLLSSFVIFLMLSISWFFYGYLKGKARKRKRQIRL